MVFLLPGRLLCKSAISPLVRNLPRPRTIPYRNQISTAMDSVLQNDVTDSLSSIFTDEVSRDILDFWFQDCGSYPTKERVMRWFAANSEFDEQCRSKFSSVLSKVIVHPLSSITSLATSPERALSLVILLDQIPRNIFRGDLSAKVYTKTDPIAVVVALHSLSSSLRYDLGPKNAWKTVPSKRIWFNMPLVHSEDLVLHTRTKEQFVSEYLSDCVGEAGEPLELAKLFGQSSGEHKGVIDRFGRYPYRNKILARENTPEETAWLENPGVSWAR